MSSSYLLRRLARSFPQLLRLLPLAASPPIMLRVPLLPALLPSSRLIVPRLSLVVPVFQLDC